MSDMEVIVEPGRQDVVLRREFDAPREVVFRAMLDPQLIPSWWGPRRYATIVDAMDVRPGGQWRFINRDEAGNEHPFRGVYHTVDAPERVIQTFEYEAVAGHVSLETMTLEDAGGGTLMTVVSVFQSIADRDATVVSGMAEGARETYERLAEVIERQLARA